MDLNNLVSSWHYAWEDVCVVKLAMLLRMLTPALSCFRHGDYPICGGIWSTPRLSNIVSIGKSHDG